MSHGVQMVPFAPAVDRLRVELADAPPPRAEAAVWSAWEELAAANPRLYDGPVLSVEEIDYSTGRIVARRDSYMRLIVQPRVPTGVRQLAATGVLTGRDAAGREGVLLGRRSHQTRMYGGMWELGPAGGVEPPARGATIEHDVLIDQLLREVHEEVELSGTVRSVAPVGVVFDGLAGSYDIVMRVEVDRAGEPRPRRWEYEELAWMPLDELGAFASAHAPRIIPPTRELLRFFGWL